MTRAGPPDARSTLGAPMKRCEPVAGNRLRFARHSSAHLLAFASTRCPSKASLDPGSIEKVSVPTADALKNIAYGLRNQFDDLLLILAADVDSKPQVTVMIGEKLAQTNTYHAGNMVKELAKEIEGGGGGQPFFATAGGKNLNGLDAVLEKARKLIK